MRLRAQRRGPAVCRPAAAHVGSLVAGGLRFGVVVARFNDLVTKPLLEGVLEGFERHGVPREEVEVRTRAERCAVCLVLLLFISWYLGASAGAVYHILFDKASILSEW